MYTLLLKEIHVPRFNLIFNRKIWPVEWEIKGEKERETGDREREREIKKERERTIRHFQRRGIDS